jgi:hypothetical protein
VGARILAAEPRIGLERALAVAAAVRADETLTAGRPGGLTAGPDPLGPSGRPAVRPSPWLMESRRLGLRDGLE